MTFLQQVTEVAGSVGAGFSRRKLR